MHFQRVRKLISQWLTHIGPGMLQACLREQSKIGDWRGGDRLFCVHREKTCVLLITTENNWTDTQLTIHQVKLPAKFFYFWFLFEAAPFGRQNIILGIIYLSLFLLHFLCEITLLSPFIFSQLQYFFFKASNFLILSCVKIKCKRKLPADYWIACM